MPFKLQDLAYQTTDLISAFRKALVEDMVRKVQGAEQENFAVRQHFKYVEFTAMRDSYNALTYEDTLFMDRSWHRSSRRRKTMLRRCGSMR